MEQNNIRLLILEDSPVQIDILTDTLDHIYKGSLTNTVTNRLTEFKTLALEDNFDAFIVDLNVLDAKAPDVSSALRELPDTFQHKVIVHSSESWSHMHRLGLNKFKTTPKGSSPFELRTALNRVLSKD